MRQLIIARKDLNMSPGKLAGQVSHASMAFLTEKIRKNAKKVWKYRTLQVKTKSFITGEDKPQWYRRADIGKFAAEAMAEEKSFVTYRPVDPDNPYGKLERCENEYDHYRASIDIPCEVYEEWIQGIFTKTICEARNRNHLLKAVTMAEELGLQEDVDFFLIKDNCLTELEPEEVAENGVGRTLTCIGFCPLPDDVAHTISRKYQLYR